MDTEDQAKQLLDPILSLFAGEDGGVSFAKLRHDFLPDMLSKEGTSPEVDEFLLMVRRFSRLCTLLQGK
jgi:hypothetical protein